MMAAKARVMGDEATLASIMAERNPAKIKALGRMVAPFQEQLWAQVKYDIVVEGNRMKFSQNPWMREVLRGTEGSVLAEAAKNDRVWGIGLAVEEAKRGRKWRGENLLGKALMEVRSGLRGKVGHRVVVQKKKKKGQGRGKGKGRR